MFQAIKSGSYKNLVKIKILLHYTMSFLTKGSLQTVALQTALNSASGGYNTFTVSYNSSTYLMTISATNPFSLLWSRQPVTAAIKVFNFTMSQLFLGGTVAEIAKPSIWFPSRGHNKQYLDFQLKRVSSCRIL
jgi:hypothetical protein